MAYRADIEIAVRGAQELKRLQNGIKSSSDAINSLNSSLNGVANLLPRSFNNINKVVGEAAANFNKVVFGTKEASDAARDYYQANKTLNNALRERLKLLNDIQTAERGTVLANIKASQAARAASGFGAFSAGIDIPTQKSIRRNKEKRAVVEAAADTAEQLKKLTDRQEEFTVRTDAAAQAAARQTAEFYRNLRVAKEVAKINAAAGPAQLLLAPAAPGAPAMGGGARRRITGQVERLGGARTADEAAATLRLAQATNALVQSTSKIDPQYNRFLPDTAALNATGRGIKQLTTNQEQFNQTVQRGIRFEAKYNQELERRRRLGIGGPATNRMPGATGVTGGPFPVAGPIPLSQFGQGRRVEAGAALRGRAGGALGNALIGGAFPLLFGQGAGAAAGGAIGGLVGGAFGGVGGFAGSLIGTLLGDIASQGQKVKQLAEDIGFSAEQTKQLAAAFKTANTDVEKFTAVIQNIRGIGLELEDQARAIQLVTRLTEVYGGSFEKTGNAITSALESGKVTQGTLNQLTSQGINIQQALADKFDVNRNAILKMAKDGKISVQSLIDTLVDLGNAPGKAAKQTQTASQLFQTAIQNLTKVVGPELERLASLFLNFGATALNALTSVLTRLGQVGTAIENRVAGKTLTNAQQQFRRDAATLKGLYATPKGKRTEQQVQQITALERLQKGRMQVIEAAQPQKTEKLKGFLAPSQAAPSGGGGRTKAPKERESRLPELEIELELAQKIAALNLRIAEAKDKGNRTTEYALEMDKILEERSAAIAKINLQNIPVAEKNAQTQIATLQANEKINQIIIERERISKEAVSTAEKALVDSQKEVTVLQVKRDRQAEYAKLIKEGVLPANAENYLQTKELVNEALKSADAAIVEAEARGASADEVDRLRKNLESIRGAGQTEIDKAKAPDKGATITDAITKTREELNELLNTEKQVVAAAQAIGDAFSQSFQGLVSGAMTAQEALAGFFQSVADYFLDMAAQIIAKWIQLTILNSILKIFPATAGASSTAGLFGAGAPEAIAGGGIFSGAGPYQFRAKGGPVSAGSPYMVGERGPELFVPGRSGTIVSNDKLGAGGSTNVVVNVDASGSKVQGDDSRASQLGGVLAAAVQAEIIKQKRPGGLLY